MVNPHQIAFYTPYPLSYPIKKGVEGNDNPQTPVIVGAGARNRTEMTSRSEDFESSASTSFTTPA